MTTHIHASHASESALDPAEERALDERLIAAGYRMPTRPLARPRPAAKRRPVWLAFLFSLLRLKA